MRQCLVCGCNIEHRNKPAIRCETCQKTFRKWYMRQYRCLKTITKLGGKSITLKEIREYKGDKLPDRCFKRGNEVDENY